MDMKSKLKFLPNLNKIAINSKPTTCWSQITIITLFSSIILLISTVNCIDLSSQLGISVAPKTINETTTPKIDRDVKDLKLMADFRAVKLRWSYEHSKANEPASFDIRYCELTSWDIEIKCRHRDLEVGPTNLRAGSMQQFENEKLFENSTEINNEKLSVIAVKRLYPIETVHQLDNSPNQYEVQIFDLRALTNYTFQVRVSRFLHEHERDSHQLQQHMPNIERRNRMQAARRLNSFIDEHPEHSMLRRVETKPFGAEATKCLADVSEVLVNTGRYFGGRISVEDSSDPRCNLIGNKSSEQTSYLFRIDHQICNSKIVDGNRIETMVLVHENKDILTHNTARFLVLCNFLQKSFTLRASISLPKVNSIVAQSRPAVITSLPQKPLNNNNNNNVAEDHSMSILLGSMPGIYRARTATTNGALSQQGNSSSTSSNNNGNNNSNNNNNDNNNNKAFSYPIPTLDEQQLMQQVNQDVNRSSPAQSSINQIVDELETNTIEKFIDKKSSRSSGQQQQQQQQQQQSAAATAKSSIATGNINNSSLIVEQRQSKQLGAAAYNSVAGNNNNNIDSLLPTMMTAGKSSTINNSVIENSREKARSLTLSSLDSNINKLPQPVQVQSKLLFVELSNPASRVGRHQQQHGKPKTTLQTNLVERSTSSSQFDTLESGASSTNGEILAQTTVPPTSSQTVTSTSTTTLPPIVKGEIRDKEMDALFSSSTNLKQLLKNKPPTTQRRQREELGDLQLRSQQQSPSITMTNNHRIPGVYIPLGQVTASSFSPSSNANANVKPRSESQSLANNNSNNNFSIKYSAAKVDEFPVGQGDVDISSLELVGNNTTAKGRGARMRASEDRLRSLSTSTLNTQQPNKSQQARATGSSWTVDNRMGEVMGATEVTGRSSSSSSNNSPNEPQLVDLIGETSNNEFASDAQPSAAGLPAVNGTLAQNITSFLLKWSLKTLTNFARKSFESLASQNGSEMASSDFIPDIDQHQHEYEQRNEPMQIDQLRINQSSDNNNQLTASPATVLENLLKSQAFQKVSTSNERGLSNGTLATVAALTTVAPVVSTAASQVIVSESKKEITTSTIKPALNNTEAPDKLLDGFMTSTNRVEEVPRIGAIPSQGTESINNYHHLRQHNHSRPSNYSKSLDFARIPVGESVASSSHRMRVSERQNNIGMDNVTTRQRNQYHQNHHHHQQQQSVEERRDQPIQSNQESAWTNRDPFYSSWMFYGLLLFIATITGIFLTFWLVTVPLCRDEVKFSGRRANEHNNENHCPDPQAFIPSQQQQRHSVYSNNINNNTQAILKVNRPTSVACIDNNLNSPRTRSLLDISYQKYDYNKLENYHNDVTTNKSNSSSVSVHVNNNSSISNNGNHGKIINNNNNIKINNVGNTQNKAYCIGDQINKRKEEEDEEDKLTARELINSRLDQQSHSSTSQRTRSTSIGSTIMVDENDCKNNEFLYTEHVLINPGLCFGESYA